MGFNRYDKKTDANQKFIVDGLRRCGRYVCIIHLPVDILVGFRGQTFLFEIKTAKGKLRPSQKKFLEEWTGAHVYVIRTLEEALEITNV